MPKKKETNKQQAELTLFEKSFCISYIQTFNATQAALNAGCSIADAYETGQHLLQTPRIKAEIEKLKEIKSEMLVFDKEDILLKQMKIAFADITDFVQFGTEEVVVVDKKTNEPQTKLINSVYLKDSKKVDGGIIDEVYCTSTGVARIKLADRQKALDWLSKYFKMYPLDEHKIEYDRQKLLTEKKGKHEPIEINIKTAKPKEEEGENQ